MIITIDESRIPVVVPHEVTMRQARLALLAAIESMPEPQRSNPFVAQLGAALGLDDAGIDALFVEASKL